MERPEPAFRAPDPHGSPAETEADLRCLASGMRTDQSIEPHHAARP